jgi:hypothetical protein
VVEPLEVGRVRHDHHPLRAALLGAANVYQSRAVGLAGQLFKVGFGLGVGRELVIITDREPKMLLGRGEGGRGRDESEREQTGEETAEGDMRRGWPLERRNGGVEAG